MKYDKSDEALRRFVSDAAEQIDENMRDAVSVVGDTVDTCFGILFGDSDKPTAEERIADALEEIANREKD